MKRTFDIHLPLPSGNVAIFTFHAADENDPDLKYVFDALISHAGFHLANEPTLVERINRLIR